MGETHMVGMFKDKQDSDKNINTIHCLFVTRKMRTVLHDGI